MPNLVAASTLLQELRYSKLSFLCLISVLRRCSQVIDFDRYEMKVNLEEKLKMSTQDEARKRMTHSRQEEEHLEDKMRHRSEAELNHPASPHIDEEAREGAVREHQREQNVQESVLERSKEEITKRK